MSWLVPQPHTQEQDDYAAGLYARLTECAVLRRVEVASEGWTPQANECHANVTEWCTRYPEYEIVRGWLYFDFGGVLGRVQFLAHSAVRAPDGLLYDITPSQASQEYPFLTANLSEDDFAALVQGGTTRLWHTPT